MLIIIRKVEGYVIDHVIGWNDRKDIQMTFFEELIIVNNLKDKIITYKKYSWKIYKYFLKSTDGYLFISRLQTIKNTVRFFLLFIF